ncbi:hypothetical protein MMPV_008197 [Pyropia vietnamensis]
MATAAAALARSAALVPAAATANGAAGVGPPVPVAGAPATSTTGPPAVGASAADASAVVAAAPVALSPAPGDGGGPVVAPAAAPPPPPSVGRGPLDDGLDAAYAPAIPPLHTLIAEDGYVHTVEADAPASHTQVPTATFYRVRWMVRSCGHLSQKRLSALMDVSASSVSTWLRCKYRGDPSAFEAKMQRLVQRFVASRDRLRAEAAQTPSRVQAPRRVLAPPLGVGGGGGGEGAGTKTHHGGARGGGVAASSFLQAVPTAWAWGWASAQPPASGLPVWSAVASVVASLLRAAAA